MNSLDLNDLSGTLISSAKLQEKLRLALSGESLSASIASAYMKLSAVQWIAEHISQSSSARLLARWHPNDLVQGSSDTDCYLFAKERGWPFYASIDFHGKVYYIAGRGLFLGSANLTSQGFGLFGKGNEEVNVETRESTENTRFIDDLFDRAVQVDDGLFAALVAWVDKAKGESALPGGCPIPDALLKALRPKCLPTRLMVAECFQSPAMDPRLLCKADLSAELRHDLSLLSISIDAATKMNTADFATQVRNSKMCTWLVEQLKAAPEQTLQYGAISSLLHDALQDSPKPYRSSVKMLLSNLLSWIQESQLQDIIVDRPSYSQRVRLI